MKNQKPVLLPLFFSLSFLHLLFIAIQWQTGVFATKPFLMAILALWFYAETKTNFTVFARYILIGLLFSMAGDICLIFEGEQYFMLGLGSFLITHLFYIGAFVKYPGFDHGQVLKKPYLTVPFMLFLFLMTWYLWPYLGKLKAPVFIYSCVITTMAISAMNMGRRVANETAILVVLGAILFVLSDTVIAINKFKPTGLSPVFTSLLIMSTYIAGQFMLSKGAVKASKSTN